ncbi:type II toxin-antitoxin system RelE family toxin [Candidatus Nitrospira allomarina]|uniref:Type II toxin-antitoxin system mRNA interferase toxin, RelE/StbE family n=1 Tax=Candidatus Nitrospira allomarina TaxID=3020900 RepID=A0AA96GAA6_9BACT|nr:type II toxin-antitoxin system mRNA interferase toxin, RelE/StbE family [Candidatus Nitrospira allomarina]WNM56470.1 type II toxin-antitoxin system mRNA interferase toxin, RelE/StbE family [Candidatus Nitrospira allomarina]
MAWYRVTYQPSILDDLQSTDQGMAQRLLDKTKWLASNVANLRHEPLHEDLPGLVQYAVGDWRILYSIDPDEHVVHIHRIATRRKLYANRTVPQDS